jgi:UDP:flavonoid glycosyltransferase YjiC (YdhE family)
MLSFAPRITRIARVGPEAVVLVAEPEEVHVRMLFTFAGGSGHFLPLTPIAAAAEDAGHIVAFAGQTAMIATVEAAGFIAFDAGGSTMRTSAEITALVRPNIEQEERAIRVGYAKRTARIRAAALVAICDEWTPDLIVCDEMDFGAMIAAERRGIPHATVIVLTAGGFTRPGLVADSLNEVRAEHGLPPDPDVVMPGRYLLIEPSPPSFRDPRYPLPATARAIRPYVLEAGATAAAPSWIAELDRSADPVVYFTLGTIFNLESGDLFTRMLDGLRELPARIVVTVGKELDPARFGPQPANVRIERFVPQAALLPRCDLAISHGGSGSVTGAMAFGVPQIVIPMGADQLHNAARVEALGIGVALDAVDLTPESVREAVLLMLANVSAREASARMRDEILALPPSAAAIPWLEALVRS